MSRTLANAMSSGRVAHAFLFTGVRGVGKTTSARLLAKCLNCVGADAASTQPAITPCNVCAPCREITGGHDLDVQEIDGASYNGVDEVRRLQDGMTFRPARDRHKIYIVDEVHMLSSAAWNAFLKTLEEPPPHVKFIFATTEVHKVPVTILSRCQRYDFKLITTQSIASRLESVLASENIAAEPAAVQILAREAAGSMRDAMSLLDQVIAFSGPKVTVDDVTHVLGVADRRVLHDLATALVDGDAPACISIVDRVSRDGFDLPHMARDILWHLRGLVVAKVCAKRSDGPTLKDLLDLADAETADLSALAERSDADDLSRLFQGFSRSFDDISRSSQPRFALEMALIRLARRPPLLPLDDLLLRIGDLERRLGAPPPGSGGGGGGTRAARRSTPEDASGAMVPATLHDPRRGRAQAVAVDAIPSIPSPSLVAADAVAPEIPSSDGLVGHEGAPISDTPATHQGEVSWRAILDLVRSENMALASTLEHAAVLQLGPERLVVAFDPSDSFLARRATDSQAMAILSRSARSYFGVATKVDITQASPQTAQLPTVASVDALRQAAEVAKARAAVEAHPVVKEVVRVFGASLREVRLPSIEG